MATLNLIEAQDRYIARVNRPHHPGHGRRVRGAACKQLREWAEKCGYSHPEIALIIKDARDMADLEANAEC